MNYKKHPYYKVYVESCKRARKIFANDNEAYNKCIEALNDFMEDYRGI